MWQVKVQGIWESKKKVEVHDVADEAAAREMVAKYAPFGESVLCWAELDGVEVEFGSQPQKTLSEIYERGRAAT